MIVFDDTLAGDAKLRLYRHSIGWEGDLSVVSSASAEPIPYDASEPLNVECRHFLECIETRRRPISDSAEALRVLSVLDACQRSLTTGNPTVPAL
jgi:UDP-2-acetamido-3-amino-2,3-dideoxy-glucuronate N-acetyltransferase